MSRSFPPPRSRPRSHTAKALEIVRLTKRPKASSAGWRLEVRSARSSILPANATPPSGEPTSAPWMDPDGWAAAVAMEEFRTASAVLQQATEKNAPVSLPSAPGTVPSLPSVPLTPKPS